MSSIDIRPKNISNILARIPQLAARSKPKFRRIIPSSPARFPAFQGRLTVPMEPEKSEASGKYPPDNFI